MIVIHSQNEINKVENEELQEYLEYSFSRMPTDILEHYEANASYFVVVESWSELTQKSIKIDEWEVTSMESDEFFNCIELVEVRENIMEILIQVSSDVSFGLVLEMKILPVHIKSKLLQDVL